MIENDEEEAGARRRKWNAREAFEEEEERKEERQNEEKPSLKRNMAEGLVPAWLAWWPRQARLLCDDWYSQCISMEGWEKKHYPSDVPVNDLFSTLLFLTERLASVLCSCNLEAEASFSDDLQCAISVAICWYDWWPGKWLCVVRLCLTGSVMCVCRETEREWWYDYPEERSLLYRRRNAEERKKWWNVSEEEEGMMKKIYINLRKWRKCGVSENQAKNLNSLCGKKCLIMADALNAALWNDMMKWWGGDLEGSVCREQCPEAPVWLTRLVWPLTCVTQ